MSQRNANKYSTIMKEKIEKIIIEAQLGNIGSWKAAQQVLDLFAVSNNEVSGCCIGEKCSVCGRDATNKLAEVIFDDDPNPIRHELTAYVCKEHFRMIVGRLG